MDGLMHYSPFAAGTGLFVVWYVAPAGSPPALIARFGNPHNPQSWCATWGLGYLPHGTLRAWAADNNSTEQLLELGLLTHSKKDGSLYSPFENRLLIPITNHWGHVVGFAARALNNTAPEAQNDPRFVLADVKLSSLTELTAKDLLG